MDKSKIEAKIEQLNTQAVHFLKEGKYGQASSVFYKIVDIVDSMKRIEEELQVDVIL